MISLPPNAAQLAASFTGLPEQRKASILAGLNGKSEQEQSHRLHVLLGNGGQEANFVKHLLGKTAPGKTDSPVNKKLSSPETK